MAGVIIPPNLFRIAISFTKWSTRTKIFELIIFIAFYSPVTLNLTCGYIPDPKWQF